MCVLSQCWMTMQVPKSAARNVRCLSLVRISLACHVLQHEMKWQHQVPSFNSLLRKNWQRGRASQHLSITLPRLVGFCYKHSSVVEWLLLSWISVVSLDFKIKKYNFFTAHCKLCSTYWIPSGNPNMFCTGSFSKTYKLVFEESVGSFHTIFIVSP